MSYGAIKELFPDITESDYDRLIEILVEEVANKLDYSEIASVASDYMDISYQLQEEASEAAYMAMNDLDVEGLKEKVEAVEREQREFNFWKADRNHTHKD